MKRKRANVSIASRREVFGVLGIALSLGACVMPVGPSRDGGGDSYVPLPDAAVSCRGNNDGVIDRSEVVFLPGAEARYRINPAGVGAVVNTAGVMRSDGSRLWDFTNPDGDLISLRVIDAAGQYFAAQFPTAQYAARLDPREPTQFRL